MDFKSKWLFPDLLIYVDIWDVFDMSPTEVGRLALDRDCFRRGVKEATSNRMSGQTIHP